MGEVVTIRSAEDEEHGRAAVHDGATDVAYRDFGILSAVLCSVAFWAVVIVGFAVL